VIVGLALNWLVPSPFLPADVPAGWLGGVVFALAIVLGVWAVVTMARAGSNVPTNRPTTIIVEHGPYRWTRNPIYFGMFLGQIGLAVAFNAAISSVLADSDGVTVGFALWFFYFGTFSGRYGLWVANLYVEERHRGLGIGLALFRHMARIAVEKDCVAMQWDVHEWNTQAVAFYDHIGSTSVSDGRLVKEMTGEALTALAKGKG